MEHGLNNKTVLVTGGTRGIGRAIVEGFLAEGANVAFCARDAAVAKRWAKSCRSMVESRSGQALMSGMLRLLPRGSTPAPQPSMGSM